MDEIKVIQTEDPKEHWGFLSVEDRIVLDLGHGIWEPNVQPTPLYFLYEGASKVIGIDPSQPSYEWYKNNLQTDKFIQHNDYIDSPDKIKIYVNYYKPHVIKCDIEGGEIYLNQLTKEDMESVKEIGIEYHNLQCKVLVQSKLQEWGFDIVQRYQLMTISIDAMGVIYGKKPRQVIIKHRKDGNSEENNG